MTAVAAPSNNRIALCFIIAEYCLQHAVTIPVHDLTGIVYRLAFWGRFPTEECRDSLLRQGHALQATVQCLVGVVLG